MNGLLLINKPKHWTSFDVVAKVRGIARKATGLKSVKVGHAGTLDPLATGLLLVLIGNYCKKAAEFSKLDKTYQVYVEIGKTSTTDDDEGEKTAISEEQPSTYKVIKAVGGFIGPTEQTPPIYSAIKIKGQRAYKSARSGHDVGLKPRPVTIHSLTDVKYSYPDLSFTTHVSSGTYIRSLARDIGNQLGTGAYLTGLIRTSIGPYSLENAYTIDGLDTSNLESKLIQA